MSTIIPRPGHAIRNRRPRQGAATVEFAIVAPLFILLVFGMIEYGRMVMVQQLITSAGREGARLGVLEGVTNERVTTVVTEYLANSSIQDATVSVTPDPLSSARYGEPVTVKISVSFDSVSWLPSPMYLGGKTLSSVAVMRRETPQ